MNTNDPQAEYGRPKEPMLSDGEVSAIAQLAMVNCQPDANPAFMHVLGAMDARDFYENLITTGKLRVVEEVDNVSTYPGDFRCSVCDGWTRSVLLNYCPGCGNKIKR